MDLSLAANTNQKKRPAADQSQDEEEDVRP
jgi:hypothetical protein